MKIISGLSNQLLATKIAQQLNVELINIEISKFANGEKKILINDNLHGENICIVQSFSQNVDENIIELLLITDALERMSVNDVTLILPWMGYSLQDKIFQPGAPISAKVIANLISNSYIKRVYLLDLHNTSIPGFFSIPTHHDSAINIFANYVKKELDYNNSIIVSPDFGGLKRARTFAQILNLNLINIDKVRDYQTGQVTTNSVTGDVTGKTCIIYDDIINTGGTVLEVAKFLKNKGAKEVHFLVSHGIFASNALEKMQHESIDSVVITNSIENKQLPANIKVLDCSSVFANNLKAWL